MKGKYSNLIIIKNMKKEIKDNNKIEDNKEEKSNLKKHSFFKGMIILIIAQILVKVFGLVYRLVIVNVPGFGNIGSGYFSAGYQIYTLMLAISSIGLPTVVAKFVSERVAIGDMKGAQRVFIICVTIFISIGALLSLLLYLFADYIAINFLDVPDLGIVFKVLAPAIVFVSASSMIRGYFTGLENMTAISVSQILEQLLNSILSIAFVYSVIGKEPHIMAAAANSAATVSIFISFIFLVIYYLKKRIKVKSVDKSKEDNVKTTTLVGKILKYSIPITTGSIISVLNNVIDTATVSRGIQKAFSNIIKVKTELEAKAMEMQGVLGKIETITMLPLAVNIALSTVLVPSLASAKALKDEKEISKRIKSSLFISTIVILPCVVGLIVLAGPILQMFYPTAPDGKYIMILLSIAMIFTGFNQTISGSLQGIGKTVAPMLALLIGAIAKIILNIVLISNPDINIYGAAIGSIVCQIITFLISYIVLIKNVKIQFNFIKDILKPLLISIIMGILVYGTYILMINFIGNTISTIIAILVGILIYVVLIFKLKAIEKEDIIYLIKSDKLISILEKLRLIK